MFSRAYEIASAFTHPLVIAFRKFDGSVEGGLGSLIALNDDGWLMTAAHNLQIPFAYEQNRKQIAEFTDGKKGLPSGPLPADAHPKAIMKKAPDPNWVTDFVILFGSTHTEIIESRVHFDHDLAFIRVNKSAVKGISGFPHIKNPKDLKTGMSLCKLGFPFYEVKPSFDPTTKLFSFPTGLFPIPRFPIDGIYTRNYVTGKGRDGLDIMYLETSSPGLKGQSGGPIFDTEGNICAVQSQNMTIPLGFTGEIEINGHKVQENQFFNVGMGVHVQTIVSLLVKHGIRFQLAS